MYKRRIRTKFGNLFIHKDIYATRKHRRDGDIYLSITCEWEWEQEHGLQLVFGKGKQLTRISDQDGHVTEADAYDKSDVEDELSSKFKNKKEAEPLTILSSKESTTRYNKCRIEWGTCRLFRNYKTKKAWSNRRQFFLDSIDELF